MGAMDSEARNLTILPQISTSTIIFLFKMPGYFQGHRKLYEPGAMLEKIPFLRKSLPLFNFKSNLNPISSHAIQRKPNGFQIII